jgi:Uma2 family endonuclease
MAERRTKTATYADIEALPPNVRGEILFGSLVTQPRPAGPHVGGASSMGMLLGNPYQFGRGGPGGWIIMHEPELHLGPHVVVPDLAGWKAERIAGKTQGKWFDVPPDWVCEVLSDSTIRYDRQDKSRIYATYRVAHMWHLEPVAKFLEVFERQNENWLRTHTFAAEEEVFAPPFEEARFRLGDLWPLDQLEKTSET